MHRDPLQAVVAEVVAQPVGEGVGQRIALVVDAHRPLDLRRGQAMRGVPGLARLAAQRLQRRGGPRAAAGGVADQPIHGAIQPVAARQRFLRDARDHGGRDPAGRVVVIDRAAQHRAPQPQAHVAADGIPGDDAVIGFRPAHRGCQPFTPAGRSAVEVDAARRLPVMRDRDGPHRIQRLADMGVAEIVQRLRIQREGGIVGTRRLVAAIAGEGQEAARQRRRRAGQAVHFLAGGVGDTAIVAAAAELQRLAVPMQRQVRLEADFRRLRIDRRDGAHHAAMVAVQVAGFRRRHQPRRGDGGAGGRQRDGGGRHPQPRQRRAGVRRCAGLGGGGH